MDSNKIWLMRLQMIRTKKGPLLLPLHLYSFWLKDQKWLAEQKRFAVSAKINESECRKLWGVRYYDLATLSWSGNCLGHHTDISSFWLKRYKKSSIQKYEMNWKDHLSLVCFQRWLETAEGILEFDLNEKLYLIVKLLYFLSS